MLSQRQRVILLLIVVVGGGILRFGAVSYGLPRHDLGQDELITAARARRGVMVARPGWPRFHWPNLNIHLSRGAIVASRWVESRAGLEKHDDVLIGRAYTAALGTLTLVVLYLIGCRLFGPWVGLTAAGLLAVVPLHAFRSRLWVPDVPMTLFYGLALLAATWILARPTYPRFLAAAVAVGLATATKYNGAGACLAVVVAALAALPQLARRWRWAAMGCRLGLAFAVAVAVFFAADWYALPHFDQVLGAIGFLRGAYVDPVASGFLGWHIWLYVAGSFWSSGYEGVGPVIITLAVAGWWMLLVRGGRAALLAWLPGLLYIFGLSSVLHDPYERMFLPVVLHIVLLAGVAVVQSAVWLSRRVASWSGAAVLAGGLALLVVGAAAVPATTHAVAARRGETRVLAARWLEANVPAGAVVMREWDMVLPQAQHFRVNRRLYDLWEGSWTPRLVSRRIDFVVTTSTNYERARRQRYRPAFARRAAYYDALLTGPLFELVARFEPDLHAFGPEVRIYRALGSSSPVLGPARRELEILRHARAAPHLARQLHQQGVVTLRAAGELLSGDINVRPGGWYRLEVAATSSGSGGLDVGLAGRLRRFRIAADGTVAVTARLRPGKNWWWIVAGASLVGSEELTVRSVRLVRVTPITLAAAQGVDAGRATAVPSGGE